ncbi:hypothetical protein Dda_7787 [Drechslerella dactyloides]|uniref:Uncharacterized protein n=1 Tax=Drechslerella dactyloides TaxID=74499 RepID=A0AAD6IR02_DREDA|nr:hypothetical protein Dda_7787 [Drechslerella dactyloides]
MILTAALALLVGSAAALPASRCDADNCLRAVRNTEKNPRGSTDCLSYFRTTVTPAVSTVTTTNTAHATATTTDSVVHTDTVSQTATETEHTTATVIVPFTVTVQETQYSAGIAKRQQTDIPSAIPNYASWCSGAVRYSSACSCMGVTGTTVTIPAETTTATTDTTVTDTTTTVTETISTEIVTVFDATTTVVVTDTTVTSSTAVATHTDITYIPLSARFNIQVQTGSVQGQYLNKASNNFVAIVPSNPTIFSIVNGITTTPDGQKVSVLGGWLTTYGSSPAVFPSPSIGTTFDNLPSAIQGTDFVWSLPDGSAQAKTWVCTEPEEWGVTGVGITIPSRDSLHFGNACTPITLKAVPVPF